MGQGSMISVADALVDRDLHRFPWPGDRRAYSPETPWLAVVNARGPWHMWQHRLVDPPFIPLRAGLASTRFWREADSDAKSFAIDLWLLAAKEDLAGIIAGDPSSLADRLSIAPKVVACGLAAMSKAGLVTYLSDAERRQVEAWLL